MMKVLFVCVHNSARSQMAEAFLNRLGQEKFYAESAGIDAGALNPLVVELMGAIGYDISKNKTKLVSDFFSEGRRYGALVKVCDEISGQRCPVFPNTYINLNWNMEDPASFEGTHEEKLEKTRQVRDRIKSKVEEFITEYSEIVKN